MLKFRCLLSSSSERFQASPRNHASVLQRSPQGFTMIEIVVVIAIIMLLAAILFPVLGRARENGRRTVCSSNLRQIALGMQQYTQDNNRRFPPVPDFSNVDEGWLSSLSATLTSVAILQCPSESKKIEPSTTDYWLNANLLGKSDVRLRTPVSVVMLGDGEQSGASYVFPKDNNDVDPNRWKPDGAYAIRHFGGSNFAFADGHIKWLQPDKVSTTVEPDGSNATFVVG